MFSTNVVKIDCTFVFKVIDEKLHEGQAAWISDCSKDTATARSTFLSAAQLFRFSQKSFTINSHFKHQ